MKQFKLYALRLVRQMVTSNISIWDKTQNFKDFLNSLVEKKEISEMDSVLIKGFLINLFDCECVINDKMTINGLLIEFEEKEKGLYDDGI